MGWVISVTLRPLYSRKDTQYQLYRTLAGPQGRSGRVRKISPPTGIRSPDRPARNESLYRLSYRGLQVNILISGKLLCLAISFPRRCLIKTVKAIKSREVKRAGKCSTHLGYKKFKQNCDGEHMKVRNGSKI